MCIRDSGQPSFDKQFARDWLKANPDNDWTLPQDIVDKTIGKYLQMCIRDSYTSITNCYKLISENFKNDIVQNNHIMYNINSTYVENN